MIYIYIERRNISNYRSGMQIQVHFASGTAGVETTSNWQFFVSNFLGAVISLVLF